MGGGNRNRKNHGNSGGRGGANKSRQSQQQQQHHDESTTRSPAAATRQQHHQYADPSSSPTDEDDDDEEEEDDEMDFCQRFFGDPLFSNLNVSLLFLTATFLPMIVWIPHFLSEYKRLRHIQFLEEERQMRMQKARAEVKGTHRQQAHQAAAYNHDNDHDGGSGSGSDDITILQDSISPMNTKSTIHFPDPSVLNPHNHGTGGGSGSGSDGSNNDNASNNNKGGALQAHRTILPTLCPDGTTIGYDNWYLLRDAISEANANSAEEFLRWNEYLVTKNNQATEPMAAPVYHPPEPFEICPGVTLNSKSPYRSILSPYYWAEYFVSFLGYGGYSSSATGMGTTQQQLSSSNQSSRSSTTTSSKSKNKLSPIFINAEDIIIECDMCTVDLPGTHFSFGPHAKNVLIRGITFRGATTSSLTFHHHGADVSLEDCYWLYNSGGMVNANRNGPYANVNGNEGLMSSPPGSTTTAGAVADLNSTSTVTFFRCVIDDVKQNPKRTTTGAGVANVPGMNPPAGHHVGGGMNQGNHGGGGSVVSSSLTIRN